MAGGGIADVAYRLLQLRDCGSLGAGQDDHNPPVPSLPRTFSTPLKGMAQRTGKSERKETLATGESREMNTNFGVFFWLLALTIVCPALMLALYL